MTGISRGGARHRTALKVTGVTILAAGLLAVGWTAAEVFVSPNQRAASVAAPTQEPITAIVEYGRLSETVAIIGTVTPAVSVEIELPASSAGVVTVAPDTGTEISPGTVVLEVSGRPVIAYIGDYPFYRELSDGDEGDDVRQLQANLSAFGHELTVDGKYGPRTSSALKALYKDMGYAAPTAEVAPQDDRSEMDNSAANANARGPSGQKGNVYFDPSEALLLVSGDLVLEEAPTLGAKLSDGAVLRLRTGGVVVSASLDMATADALNEGDAVRMTDNGGATYSGTMDSITADTETDTAQDAQAMALIVLDPDSDVPALDEQLVALIETNRVAGDSLLVPTRAVVNRENGAVVYVVQAEGTRAPVSVRELGTLSGMSAIEVIHGDLAVGDEVEIG